ncbi:MULTISPECIES: DUF3012 domain-containing protein [unclassified Thioalkalivibrio]|uniref:DUF3012 domain-containing protein n=1 Tax=unclassified Thioalkalivibrio TaxID=2621013 RepID=UPI00035D8628|nr:MULTISPECIES: DUF3012 domain-containing protein [unclassified Thioalkalivibrio]
MNTLPSFTAPAIAGLAFVLITFSGCGQSNDSAQAAEPDTIIQEEPDAPAMERAIGFLESWIELFDTMSAELAGVESREAANEHATWLTEELTPRLEQLASEMIVFMESIEEHEMEVMEASFDAPENHQRMLELEGRMEQSLDRLEENIMRVETAHATPALEMAWLNFARTNERLERQMEATFAGGAQAVGSPAWCDAMANTPQAQWTMNDAFAFANHCVGR